MTLIHRVLRRSLATGALATAGLCAAPAFALDGWHQLAATVIEGKGSAWDYVSLDPARNRLFVGHRKEGLQVIDLATGKLVKVIEHTDRASSNGAVLMPEFDLGVSYNEDGTLTPFKLSTLEAREPVKLGDELDSAHYDPATKRLVVNMAADKEGTDLVVVDMPSLRKVGAVRVTTKKPEHAEADGKGFLYVASRDENKVYKIDTQALKVVAQWPTPGCAQTNGLAVDAANRRIFLGCRGSAEVKPSFAVMNADTGAIVYTSEIGGGNDGVVFDPDLKRIFLANGVNAVLNVFEQVGPDAYRPVEALGTRAGVRTMAYDAKTKKLYSVTAEGSADYAKKITTTVSPYYANTFFPNSFVVLTYGRN
jgi:DNA-binding beta-propeller fold protein YncE